MPSPALVLLALAAAAPPAVDQDFELPPLPPMVEVQAPPPAVVVAPPPEAPRPVITVAPRAVEAPLPTVIEEAPSLIPSVPWLESGSGSLTLKATGLAGRFATLTSAGVGVALDRFQAGLTFTTGGHELVGLTLFGVRGGARLVTVGRVHLTAALGLSVGVASMTVSDARTSAAVFAFQPEVGARVQLLPWARAHATLGYRMVDAAEWKGPDGDALGGLEAGVGLEFGAF